MGIHRSIRVLLPFIVLAGFGFAAYQIAQSSPDIRKAPVAIPRITVETVIVTPVSYTIQLPSYGRVQPRTQSNLVAQVSGQIIEISEHFRNGGYVNKDEVLVGIDPVDYQVQIDIAQGDVVEAELALEEEKARGGQARKDWTKIGGLESASDLALRIPQLRAARARLATAKARLRQARVNLQRTQITAPYAGRILTTHVDLGAVITPQLILAELYATDYVEVRLPVKSADLTYIQLPEAAARADKLQYPQVSFSNNLIVPEEQWQGRIVRTEGAIDAGSQQLYVIAQIDDPFGLQVAEGDDSIADQRYPLKIGQYLPAVIKGRTLEDSITIPNSVIYQGSFVYLIKNDVLVRQEIELGFQDKDRALVSSGINVGDELVLTNLGQVASGTAITRLATISTTERSVAGSKPIDSSIEPAKEPTVTQ
jgi:RND family efflux transporter MFP subunit